MLRPENEQNKDIKEALKRLNTLDIQTTYPFLLMAYDAYESKQISFDDLLHLFKVLENYIVRRFVCSEPTNYLNKIFPTFWHDITTEMTNELPFKEALTKVLLTKGYPPDRSIKQAIQTAKLYGNPSRQKLCLILETINRHISKGTGGFGVLDNEPTIEHILPQTPSEDWKTLLGDKLEQTYQSYLHTLGNLTLVTQEWNSALSNAPFLTKKEILANHALKLNNEYFSQNIEQWNEESIIERANFLTEKFLEIWSAIGEPPLIDTKSYGIPKVVTICGETIVVPDKTWLQLMKLTTEWVIKNRPQYFEKARQILGTYLYDNIEGKRYPKHWYQLSNGIWVLQNNSAKGHVSFCRRLLTAVGISESDWSIEEVGSTPPTIPVDT
ncbi:MAG: HNH endonuclease family protein [Gloeocapsa sp. UFS-A4-WI-NPMV-4B04]|nr:HNH endonuclease family protein [Gloeocapsa sp. UFS-A4-WI-NPMV-4B04]